MALCESNCSGIGSLLSVGVGVGQPTRYPMLRPPTPIAARPVGLQPTDSTRGPSAHGLDPWASTPWGGRYKGVDGGSSPRKTTLTRFHGVLHKSSLQENFPRTGLLLAGKGREG